MKNNYIKNLALSAMFLGIGLVLPFLTGQIKQIGNMLLPMHIPVLLCGLICGAPMGLAVGFVTPILRSLIFSMPYMYPTAVAMAFELATYGAVVGYLYSRSKWKCVRSLFRCMITSMISGRVVWGVVQTVLLGVGGDGFTLSAFVSGAFLSAIPGIAIQLVLIPVIMVALNRAKLVRFSRSKEKRADNDK